MIELFPRTSRAKKGADRQSWLRRLYTFVVMSILIVLFGGLTIQHMPTDVLPNILIPVTSVVWVYSGLLPQQVEGRITYLFERFVTATVEGHGSIYPCTELFWTVGLLRR